MSAVIDAVLAYCAALNAVVVVVAVVMVVVVVVVAAAFEKIFGFSKSPRLSLIVNVTVCVSVVAAPPPAGKCLKESTSPLVSPYSVIWNIAVPLYAPNGGTVVLFCTPRTAPLALYATSVPVVMFAPSI